MSRHKFHKELFTHRTGGELPSIVVAQDEHLQSKFVVQKVLELREQGIPLNEMSVLFRSSYLSFDLEIELNKANIPFVKFGGFKFIETSHIKDLVAYLRVLENPRDAVAWNRILLLVDGVGPRTAERVIEDIAARRVRTDPGWTQNEIPTGDGDGSPAEAPSAQGGISGSAVQRQRERPAFWANYASYPEKVR